MAYPKTLDPLLLTVLILQVFQLATYTPFFDSIPIVRYVAVFIFLTFCPGLLILKLFVLPKLGSSEVALFSVGCSLVFIMIFGIALNFFLSTFGITTTPLSFGILSISLNALVFLMWLFASLKRSSNTTFSLSDLKPSDIPAVLLLIVILLLSVIGSILVNSGQGNTTLILMLVFISFFMVLAVSSKKILPVKFYPLALLIISMALLFHTAFATNSIYGWDINTEYAVAQQTIDDLQWVPNFYTSKQFAKMNGMLSVTILPAVYSILSGISLTWVMKFVFPFLFAFISLGLYTFFKQRWGNKISFLAVFFFMSYGTFFTEMITLQRQMIAELFFVLLLVMLFVFDENREDKSNNFFYFAFFAVGLVVSHYAISYIVGFLLLIVLGYLLIFKKPRKLTSGKIMLLFVLMFAWYVYVSNASAFNDFVRMANNMVTNFASDFLNPAARGNDTMKALGLVSASSFLHTIGRYLFNATVALVAVGFVKIIVKRRSVFPKKAYDTLLYLCVIVLGLSVILPNFATTLRIARVYHILLIVLAPLCITGGIFLFSSISRKRLRKKHCALLLTMFVLIPFFLFQTEFVYEVTNDVSYSMPLSSYRLGPGLYDAGSFTTEDLRGAEWIYRNAPKGIPVYSDDSSSSNVLVSYGMVAFDLIGSYPLTNQTPIWKGSLIYLNGENTIYQNVVANGNYYNISQIYDHIDSTNTVYSNGVCMINQKP